MRVREVLILLYVIVLSMWNKIKLSDLSGNIPSILNMDRAVMYR